MAWPTHGLLIVQHWQMAPEDAQDCAGLAIAGQGHESMGKHGQWLMMDVGGHERHEAPKGAGGMRVIVHGTQYVIFEIDYGQGE